jgi:UDP-N-acetylmuramoylalanine--D-glutamate ligase
VLLNLEPDHLDRHGTLAAYRAAKLRIFERAALAVVPRGGGLAGIEFAADDELPAEPLLRGRHNRENAAAATAAARAAGIGDEHIADALRTFAGVPHRLELVAEIDGVRYVNDSKATNVAAAIRAIEAYDGEIVHLILGGSTKNEDFRPLADAIGPSVQPVHFIGAEGPRMIELIDGHIDGTLERAVEHARRLAKPGEIVLLSPACASYDQFENFEQRGEAFRRLVTN